MSTDEYVPNERYVRDRYSEHTRCYLDGAEERLGSELEEGARAEFDRFIEAVKRDAAREALDGYAAAEEDSFLSLHVKDAPIAAAQCTHAAITAREYRDTHYGNAE